MRAALLLAFLLVLPGCTPPYSASILYQATTPDCRNWADGSRFALPEGADVFASSPKPLGDGALELDLAYFVPKNGEVTFTTHEFVVTTPHGPPVAVGRVALTERGVPGLPGSKTVVLSELPMTLRGDAIGDETMYRVNVQITSPLPDRFDFTPPQMILRGKTYPVRTLTYRWFAERKTYGLCT